MGLFRVIMCAFFAVAWTRLQRAVLGNLIVRCDVLRMTTLKHHPQPNIWFDYQQLNQAQLPNSVRKWLLDMGSLSERLISASNDQFQVQVLNQGFVKPALNESQLLRIKPHCVALIRESALLCAGQPWVFARSIIPLSSMQGRLRQLRKFSNISLGALLFNDPYLHRSPFQVALIDPAFLPETIAPKTIAPETITLNTDANLWGRRSCFYLHDHPLLVSEIFLPSFKP